MLLLGDFQTTVRKAFDEIDPKWESYEGLVVCGTHAPKNVENILKHIADAREIHMPFLGICFGHQLAAIEYAKNVLGIEDATSEELLPLGGTYIVEKMRGLFVGLGEDGESYWHNYAVIQKFYDLWKKEDNFITCQYHPEYQSTRDKPHPLLVKFLNYAKAA